MSEEKFKARDVQPTVLRLGPELREKLIKIAFTNGRSLTKEISARLQESLQTTPEPGIAPGPHSYPKQPMATVMHTNEPGHASTALDQAMLKVFHALPVEKQLSLLTLLK